MTINTLTFGIELECYRPAGVSMQAAADAVAQRLGKPCAVIPYSRAHEPCSTWKVTTDGSLGDYATGCEFVSPVLTGEEGKAEVAKVLSALNDLGCTVSKDCGTHAHIGVRGVGLPFFKNIVRLYQAYEPLIDSMMPVSRRASNNGFCRTMTALSAANINAAHTISELSEALRRSTGAHERRYHKVNLDAFNRHGTVEFRQHSGTLDETKIINWLNICQRMVVKAMGEMTFGSPAAAVRNTARPGSKAHQIGQMLLRPEGVTGPEICQAKGWPSVSVPAQARAAGLTVVSQRTGRMVRYFVRREAEAQAATMTITVEGLAALIGMTASETAYVNNRINNLRGSIAWAA